MDKFQFTKFYNFCNYSPNLKTLFIEVTDTEKPITRVTVLTVDRLLFEGGGGGEPARFYCETCFGDSG